VPVAETEKVAAAPAVKVWLAGFEVIDGATGAGFTVSVAAALATDPAALLTVALNASPLFAVVVAAVVYEAALAPEIAAPFIIHW
jgi:hypothetical protein